MIIMGIDPGLKGGVAFYDGNNIEAFYTPVLEEEFVKAGKKKKRNVMDLPKLCDMIHNYKPNKAILEKVTARPGQGVTSMFRFGQGFGEFRGILAALHVTWIEVPPQAWKGRMNLSSDKDASLQMARELWPEKEKECFRLKKQDGVAEAALMAKYGFDNLDLFEYVKDQESK